MMKNKEIEELLNSIDKIIKEAPDEAIYGIQIKEYKQMKNHIEQLENKNESLLEDRKQLLNLVKQLENNRDKALKYIEKYKYYTHSINVDDLLNILKGDSDEFRNN